jgi:hypothetical protein
MQARQRRGALLRRSGFYGRLLTPLPCFAVKVFSHPGTVAFSFSLVMVRCATNYTSAFQGNEINSRPSLPQLLATNPLSSLASLFNSRLGAVGRPV